MKKLLSLPAVIGSLVLVAGCACLQVPGGEPAPALSAQQVIDSLRLQPMADVACKGYYLGTYESKTRAVAAKERSAASLIYYLMTRDIPIDPWHIITSDEIMLYHAGAPMAQLLLYPDGRWDCIILGPRLAQGHVAQTVIPAGTWMGFVKLADPRYDWGLYGVMVVPGWHMDDIRAANDAEVKILMEKYPAAVPSGCKLGLFP